MGIAGSTHNDAAFNDTGDPALNTGWISATRTDANGNFRCAVLHSPNRKYRARFRLGKKSSSEFSVQQNTEPETFVINPIRQIVAR